MLHSGTLSKHYLLSISYSGTLSNRSSDGILIILLIVLLIIIIIIVIILRIMMTLWLCS